MGAEPVEVPEAQACWPRLTTPSTFLDSRSMQEARKRDRLPAAADWDVHLLDRDADRCIQPLLRAD